MQWDIDQDRVKEYGCVNQGGINSMVVTHDCRYLFLSDIQGS
jgi:hypothetical protein